jgi:RNA polymerase sigma-70 factor (ECF subfamily)
MDLAEGEIESLVDRAIDGDRAGLEQLLARVHPLIVRFCRARLSSGHRSLATADDIAQEVCMAVMSALPTYRRDSRPFLAFVYGIAAHKVIDAHRAAARSPLHPVAEVPEAPTTERDPEETAMAVAAADSMTDLMDVLPGQQREILLLRVGVGLSAEETADALGMTAGAVRVAQHRALAKLRKVLAADHSIVEQLL